MRLDEHSEFVQLVALTAEELRQNGQPKIRDEHVEKDYWVTEVLRLCNDYLGPRALFKGGTSLSKGWGIIKRFSEDVDLAILTVRDGNLMSSGQVRDDLSRLAKFVGEHPGLSRDDARKRVAAGMRDEYYIYDRKIEGLLAPEVKLEAGTRSGQVPNIQREIQSDVMRFIHSHEIALPDVDLQQPFEMRLMDRTRTFIEKFFAIHSEVERYVREARDLGGMVRHYYDLNALAQEQEVRNILGSQDDVTMRNNYADICAKNFPSSILPEGLSFRDSIALFPPAELRKDLGTRYAAQMNVLCFEASPPTFESILERFESLRDKL